MELTKFQLFLFYVICCLHISESASIVKNVGVDSMEKLASGCEQFILIKDGMKEKVYDFYFSGSGDLLNFFDKLDTYLEKESKNDAKFAKMVNYFYVCMNDASRASLDQLKAFVNCPAFKTLKKRQEERYESLLRLAGKHLSDGQILLSLRKELENNSSERLLDCISLKNN
ncbi:uncharacterized protein [Leptinotarsa decemlineata]|uniref:uncharacterized protein n=1 Tax=Leptinotarsa decemlineata TaxID=7539 RepID=UPI000C251962|nr:uncharacterized protein LOC111501891 [Leptinotarsa decemlineata]